MIAPARTELEAMHIVALVPLLSDPGLLHIPLFDRHKRLAGLAAGSDLTAAR